MDGPGVNPAAAPESVPGRASAPGRDAPPAQKGIRAWLRSVRAWLILAVIVLILVLVSALAEPKDRRVLSPGNPAPAGAMALVEVLRDQGVSVKQADSLDDAVRALGSASSGTSDGTTLVFHDPEQRIDDAGLARLRNLPDRLVLVEPTFSQLQVLAPGIRTAGYLEGEGETLPAACSEPDATAAKEVVRGGFGFRGPAMCFRAGNSGASYVATADRKTVVLGNQAILQNGSLANAGHAALALRTLGSQPRLIWYQPTLADIPVTESAPSPQDLLPPWVRPAVAWLLFTALLLMAWKGRRDGPLVTEPLPVVVRAAETAEGRARLYQDAGSVQRAADTLRSATLARLAHHLKLSPAVEPSAIPAEIERTGGRSATETARLLRHTPIGAADLAAWAQELLVLEKEIDTK